MARMPYPDESKLPAALRGQAWADAPNVTRMLAGASEAVYAGFGAFGSALINASDLPGKLREIAILRSGYVCNSKYETWQHEAFGRYVGLSDAQIDAVREGDIASPALDEEERAVLAFADDVIQNVRASDETLGGVRKFLTDAQVIDLILVTGAYLMVSRFLETTGVELDENPIDWDAYSKA
jgi:4-carboxymuconolactone decarboxylase